MGGNALVLSSSKWPQKQGIFEQEFNRPKWTFFLDLKHLLGFHFAPISPLGLAWLSSLPPLTLTSPGAGGWGGGPGVREAGLQSSHPSYTGTIVIKTWSLLSSWSLTHGHYIIMTSSHTVCHLPPRGRRPHLCCHGHCKILLKDIVHFFILLVACIFPKIL